MKKLVFATALAIGSLTMVTAAAPIFNTAIVEEVTVQDFQEIATSDVPEAVTTALAADHPDVVLSKAYVNGSGIYKLEVASADGSTSELYADAEGNWVEL
ncbi:hypothetical protein [Maribacter sp. 2210JD10-5]|uniref:hypothetical protein n=1 Tax=Maribacter sp. 2210JD10-5 TaxID=3386272 RepID=UPI0039BD37B6